MTFKLSHRHLTWAAVAVALLILALWPATGRAQDEPPTPDAAGEIHHDPRFGIVEAFWRAEDAADLDVGWDRILFYWNEIQPTGPDDWNTLHVLEEWLDDAREQDRIVMGLLKNTPPWATDAEPYSGVPRGLYLPVDDPGNLWAGYVRKVVTYYAPLGVHHWIIWNEPEIGAGVYGHEFSGSTQDYYQLLKVAYQAAKAADPEAVIHLAGWSYWHDPTWLGQFLNVATADPEAAANNYFFDAVTLHIYFRVETVEELINEVWAIQRRYGLEKPIWINETNASPNLDPLWPVERPNFQVDLEQQAWYIVQAHALGFGANANSIGIYKLLDILLPPGGESFGTLRPDGSRRPGFDAHRNTIAQLEGFAFPVGRQQAQNFYSFAFDMPEGVTRVLWARVGMDMIVRVPALAEEARIVSALGDESYTVRAHEGHYRIRLRGARCNPACDIGGPPVFLVEKTAAAIDVQQVATIAPDTAILATLTPTATFTATPDEATLATLAAASPTPEPTATSEPTATPSPTLTPSATATAEPTNEPTATASVAPTLVATTATPSSDDGGSLELASWVFIAAAVLLGGVLLLVATRGRQ